MPEVGQQEYIVLNNERKRLHFYAERTQTLDRISDCAQAWRH